jgi:hypothetical protein
MPKPQPTRIPRGDELLTVNQAIELIAYGDLDRARKTQEIHISERAWSSRSVLAYMDSKVMDALWTLWRMLEDGTVEAIERDRPVPPSRWSGDRLARLAPGEERPRSVRPGAPARGGPRPHSRRRAHGGAFRAGAGCGRCGRRAACTRAVGGRVRESRWEEERRGSPKEQALGSARRGACSCPRPKPFERSHRN